MHYIAKNKLPKNNYIYINVCTYVSYIESLMFDALYFGLLRVKCSRVGNIDLTADQWQALYDMVMVDRWNSSSVKALKNAGKDLFPTN